MIDSAPVRRAATAVAILAAACAGLAGCGGRDDSAAHRAAQEYVDAYNGHDYDRVCDLLSDGYTADLLAGEGEEVEKIKCPEWFEEHTSGTATTLTLGDVEENGGRATADVQSKSEDSSAENDLALRLQRQPNGAWQIVDLTTAPTSG